MCYEFFVDSGSRLRSSVNHLLEVMEETTSQLLETRQSQSDAMDTLEGKGQDVEQLTSRCNDLEERLKEEVERKDFLALELHKAEGRSKIIRRYMKALKKICQVLFFIEVENLQDFT